MNSSTRITSVPMSFRSCADGMMAPGKASIPTNASKPQSSAGGYPARKSALNLEVLSRRLALVRDFFVFDDLPFIETAEACSLDRRDMDKNIFAAALRLNESVALLRIEPLHGTFSHQPAPNGSLPIVIRQDACLVPSSTTHYTRFTDKEGWLRLKKFPHPQSRQPRITK